MSDPNQQLGFFKSILEGLGSRKLAVAAVAMLGALNLEGVDSPTRVWALVAVACAYLIGQGVADLAGEKK